MIKLTSAEYQKDHKILLRFSDNSWGVYDFVDFVKSGTAMTIPLADLTFFQRFFIELGALAWPNGFDLSAASLHKRLDDQELLHRDATTARPRSNYFPHPPGGR